MTPKRPALRHGRWAALGLALVLLVCAPAWPRAWPRPDGPVADFAQVIGAEEKQSIDALARQVLKATGVTVVVATLPSLEGRPLEETAVDLYRQWGVGQKGVSKGLLILVAVKEKRLRLEVGYGLEEAITDAQAGQIRDQVMIPLLRQGDYGQGLRQGVAAVAQRLYHHAGLSLEEPPSAPAAPPVAKPRKDRVSGHWLGWGALVVILVFYLVGRGLRVRGGGGDAGFWTGLLLGSLFGGGGGGRHWDGHGSSGGFDSFGGGFGGFGGGMSGGGGASGDFGDGGGGE